MLAQAAAYLVDVVLTLFLIAFLLRFYLQAFRAPFRNPVSQFVVALTDFAVLRFRRFVPGIMGLDMASLLLAWLVQYGLLLALAGLSSRPFGSGLFLLFALLACVELVKVSIYLFMGVIIVQAILSFVNPYTPIAPVLSAITDPFYRPIRKFIPLVGGIDLSPLVLIVALQLILMLPVRWLQIMLGGGGLM
jgi:YggT family protein